MLLTEAKGPAVFYADYPSRLAGDETITISARDRRTIITNDTDFPTRQARLTLVLTEYADLLDQLIVVTLDSVRVRRRC